MLEPKEPKTKKEKRRFNMPPAATMLTLPKLWSSEVRTLRPGVDLLQEVQPWKTRSAAAQPRCQGREAMARRSARNDFDGGKVLPGKSSAIERRGESCLLARLSWWLSPH